MEWFKCPDCRFNHPWLPGDRPCPNLGIGKGRPLKKDTGSTLEAKKPWEVEGVSRATWFAKKRMDSRVGSSEEE